MKIENQLHMLQDIRASGHLKQLIRMKTPQLPDMQKKWYMPLFAFHTGVIVVGICIVLVIGSRFISAIPTNNPVVSYPLRVQMHHDSPNTLPTQPITLPDVHTPTSIQNYSSGHQRADTVLEKLRIYMRNTIQNISHQKSFKNTRSHKKENTSSQKDD